MRLLNLELKNIGLFVEGNINFISEEDNIQKPPVTIITGENGTGKTIVLVAIRGLLLATYQLERHIIRNDNDFSVSLKYATDNKTERLSCSELTQKNQLKLNSDKFRNRFLANQEPDATWNWVIDYWTSKLSLDSFEVKNLVAPIHENIYVNSLDCIQKNVEIAQLICFFDDLKNSQVGWVSGRHDSLIWARFYPPACPPF